MAVGSTRNAARTPPIRRIIRNQPVVPSRTYVRPPITWAVTSVRGTPTRSSTPSRKGQRKRWVLVVYPL